MLEVKLHDKWEESEMTKELNNKPNYNDPQQNHEFRSGNNYENAYGQQTYLPANYYDYNSQSSYPDDFYREEESSSAGSFLFGALVGGVIGAAAALFLAPKSGSEMREDLSSQASQLKSKSIEISTVAKERATELSSVAKEKTGELTKTIQEQSGQIVDKVKSMKSKTAVPMDDGTVSSEGEESIEFVNDEIAEVVEGQDFETSTAEALKKAVITSSDKVQYDNSDNVGEEKVMNQNAVTDIKSK